MFWFKKKETIVSTYQTTTTRCEEDMLDVIEQHKNIISKEQVLTPEKIDYDIKDIKVIYLDRSEATRTYNLFIVLTVKYTY